MIPTYVELLAGGGERKHPGWLGWGQPALLSKAQATAHASNLRDQGKCGAITPTASLGFAVCDQLDECEGQHCDGRHQIVWTEHEGNR